MQIQISRNGQKLGLYSIEEINRKLVEGTLSPADQAWDEGASGWTPLSTIPGVVFASDAPSPPVMPVSTPPSSPAPSASVARPAQVTSPKNVPSAKGYTGMAVISWVLLGLNALVTIVPLRGLDAVLMAFIVVPVVLILAIIILFRRGTAQGILLLITSLILLPTFIIGAALMNRKD